jgi:hypothetical protein
MSEPPSYHLVTLLNDWQDPCLCQRLAALVKEQEEGKQVAADMRRYGMDRFAELRDKDADGIRQELDRHLAQLGEIYRLLESDHPDLLPLWGRKHSDGKVFQNLDPGRLSRAIAQILAAVLARPAPPSTDGKKLPAERSLPLGRQPRLAFDKFTQAITLDGTPYQIADPKAFSVYKAIAEACPQPVTAADIRPKVAGCKGKNKVGQLLNTLPAPLRATVRSGNAGYWLSLDSAAR